MINPKISLIDSGEESLKLKKEIMMPMPNHLCPGEDCESDDSGCVHDLRQDLKAPIKGNDWPGVQKILGHSAKIHKDKTLKMRGLPHGLKAIQWAIEQAIDQNRFSILTSLLEIAKTSGRMDEICAELCTGAKELPIVFRSKSPEAAETLLAYLPRPKLFLDTGKTFLIHCIREGIVINKEVAMKLKSQIGVRFDGKLPIEEGKKQMKLTFSWGLLTGLNLYRVTLVVEYLSWVDLDLGSFPGCWPLL